MVADAIGKAGNPAQYLISQRYLEALAQIGADADKIPFLSYEASGVLASLGRIRELLQAGGGAAPPGPSPPPATAR